MKLLLFRCKFTGIIKARIEEDIIYHYHLDTGPGWLPQTKDPA